MQSLVHCLVVTKVVARRKNKLDSLPVCEQWLPCQIFPRKPGTVPFSKHAYILFYFAFFLFPPPPLPLQLWFFPAPTLVSLCARCGLLPCLTFGPYTLTSPLPPSPHPPCGAPFSLLAACCCMLCVGGCCCNVCRCRPSS